MAETGVRHGAKVCQRDGSFDTLFHDSLVVVLFIVLFEPGIDVNQTKNVLDRVTKG